MRHHDQRLFLSKISVNRDEVLRVTVQKIMIQIYEKVIFNLE